MADALGFFGSEFELHTGAHEDYLDALLPVLRASYDLSDQDVLRNRVLVAEQGLVGVRRTPPRERGGPDARRAPGSATWNSCGRPSSFAAWSSAFCPRPIRGCSLARGSGSTAASGTGIARRVRSASTRCRSSSSAGSWRCSVCRPNWRTAIAQLVRAPARRPPATRPAPVVAVWWTSLGALALNSYQFIGSALLSSLIQFGSAAVAGLLLPDQYHRTHEHHEIIAPRCTRSVGSSALDVSHLNRRPPVRRL